MMMKAQLSLAMLAVSALQLALAVPAAAASAIGGIWEPVRAAGTEHPDPADVKRTPESRRGERHVAVYGGIAEPGRCAPI
jgi:hypothetical protein